MRAGMRKASARVVAAVLGLGVANGGCAKMDDAPAEAARAPALQNLFGDAEEAVASFAAEPMAPAAPPMEAQRGPRQELAKRKMDSGRMGGMGALGGLGLKGMGAGGGGAGAAVGLDDMESDAAAANEGGASAEPAPTRAWFPETFLFEPLVVTDASGKANVQVKVPDRLTTWRVLALAHAREGSQAGAVARFQGSLPVYVDPVLPPFLMAGDEVRLPVQVVNTTAQKVRKTLELEALNASVAFTGGELELPARGAHVAWATLAAPKPGAIALRASLGSADAVEKALAVRPTGRPVQQQISGTLASPRTRELIGPVDLDPGSARVRLQVYPGALALLRTELASAPSRGGAAEDAYTLLLAGKAPALLASLGEQEFDAETLRTLALVAGQRVIRHGRAPGVDAAILLTEAALAHPDNPVISRLGERLASQLARAQRPDGTFSGADGWTLQRLLVTTAASVRALQAAQGDAEGARRYAAARVRSSGAFERNLGQVQDGYTAAWILASGAATGTVAEKLRGIVREAVAQREDGSRALKVDPGVVRPDGHPPGELEAAALAALALEGDPAAPWVADLGATLLAGYSPGVGWGDGLTNRLALSAVLALFKEPVPADVKLVLELDGQEVATGSIDASKRREVVTLEAGAARAAGAHAWTVRAEPAVPGLGFTLTLESWVPWKKESANGLELEVEAPQQPQVGKPSDVVLHASAPSGVPFEIRQALPSGVQPDTASLEALVEHGTISSYRIEDGAVTLACDGIEPGVPFTAKYRVVATLGGRLHAAASRIDAAGTTTWLPPQRWEIR